MPEIKNSSEDQSRSWKAFQFATKHFAMLSTVAALAAYLLATIFLFAYLSFFDWRLIWLIEYSDVIKVGVVALAFISSLSGLLLIYADDAAHWRKEHPVAVRKLIRSAGITFLLGAAVWVFHEYRTYPE